MRIEAIGPSGRYGALTTRQRTPASRRAELGISVGAPTRVADRVSAPSLQPRGLYRTPWRRRAHTRTRALRMQGPTPAVTSALLVTTSAADDGGRRLSARTSLQSAHSGSLADAAGMRVPTWKQGALVLVATWLGVPVAASGPGKDHQAGLAGIGASRGNGRRRSTGACAGRRPACGTAFVRRRHRVLRSAFSALACLLLRFRRWRLDRMLDREIRRSPGAERRQDPAGSCAAPSARLG